MTNRPSHLKYYIDVCAEAEKHAFQAEVNKMMQLIINSLYRNKEVRSYICRFSFKGGIPPLAKELPPPPLDLGCHLTILSRYVTAPAKI